jgi:predicted nucleic acid-binding protein
MPPQSLLSLTSGTDVFIDANILIYGLTGQSAQCRAFLDRCAREELVGISLIEIVNEATHRFMLAEAFAKGIITKESASHLRKQFKQLSSLNVYWTNTERILNLNILLQATNEIIIHGAQPERVAAGLLTNDSMIVSCMRDFGIRALATNDGDFERVIGITVYKPDDIP